MRKLFLAMVLLLSAFVLQANAAVGVLDDGAAVGQATNLNIKGTTGDTFDGNTYSVDMTKPATLDVASSLFTVSAQGTVDATKIEVDGAAYAATITVSTATYPMKIAGGFTLDPCPTLGAGSIFLNQTTGAPCFCNTLGVDLSLYNGTSACF